MMMMMMMMWCKRVAQVPRLCVPIYNLKLAMIQKTPIFTTFLLHTKMHADKRGQIEVFGRIFTYKTGWWCSGSFVGAYSIHTWFACGLHHAPNVAEVTSFHGPTTYPVDNFSSRVNARQIQLPGSHFLCHATASARGSSAGPLGTVRGRNWRVYGQMLIWPIEMKVSVTEKLVSNIT